MEQKIRKLLEIFKNLRPKEKKILLAAIALLLAFLMLPSSKTVAKPVEISKQFHLPEIAIQDPRAWGQGEVSLSDSPMQMEGYYLYKYKMSTQLLEEYIGDARSPG